MRAASRRAEAGAIAIALALLTCFVVIPLGALAVDLGVQRVARSDMQTVADTVALDMARVLQAGGTPTAAMASASAARTAGAAGVTPTMAVYLGYIAPTATFVSDQSLGCAGTTAAYDSYFQSPSAGTPNAVLVTATTAVNFAIHGGAGATCRSAIGQAGAGTVTCSSSGCSSSTANACYEVRSYLLDLATENSTALNGLLGNALNVSAVSYSGLASANISALGLATQLGLGTVSNLANANVTFGQLISAATTVLSQNGGTAAQLSILNALTAGMSGSLAGTVISMGSLLKVASGAGSALDGQMNVLDLIGGSASLINGSSFLTVPGITVSIPSVASVTVKAKLIQPPQMACNGATASTGQLQLQIQGNLSVLSSGSLLSFAQINAGTLTITASLATANAAMTAFHCTNDVPDSMTLQVTDQSLANLSVSYSGLTISTLNLLGISLAPISMGPVSTTVTQPDPSGTYTIALPTYYDPTFYTTPQTQAPLPTFSSGSSSPLVTLLGLTLTNAPTVAGLINPVITNLNSALTGTVLPALGITLAGADLAAVATPTCPPPHLVG